jgi:hypothetical protein
MKKFPVTDTAGIGRKKAKVDAKMLKMVSNFVEDRNDELHIRIDGLLDELSLLVEMEALSDKEIKALEKKIDAPIKRGGNKNAIIPPKLSEREKYHIMYVMLKNTRDKNKKDKLKNLTNRGLHGVKR